MRTVSYSIEIRDRFSAMTKKFSRNIKAMAAGVGKVNARMSKFTNIFSSRIFRYGLPLGILYAIKSFADFEESMYKVAKTADIRVGPELDSMASKFKELSELMPNTASDLALVGAAAAQMGVRGERNIVNFAKTMGMLSSATDVYGQEGVSTNGSLN